VSRFVMAGDVPVESYEWGDAGMRCAPPGTGCESFVVMDVRLDPGFFHAFHKHPDQDEMITVVSGKVTQYLEGESTVLGPGDRVRVVLGGEHAALADHDRLHRSEAQGSSPETSTAM